MYVYVYMCMYVCVYIYIIGRREAPRDHGPGGPPCADAAEVPTCLRLLV